jgi:hypothetical protein
MKKDKKEKMECPLCHGLMRPVYEEDAVYCSACRTDLKPYAEAYVEYVKVRAKQNSIDLGEVNANN